MKTKRILVLSTLLTLSVIGALLAYQRFSAMPALSKAEANGLPYMNAETLAQYDGTEPDQAIYLAMDGYVYDVTAGRQYYVSGGDYHDLAGRDASADLQLFGGEIIKRKYPVIARFGEGQ